MNAFAGHDIRQCDAGREHPHAHFPRLRLRTVFLDDLECIGSAVVSCDDAQMSYGSARGVRGGADVASTTNLLLSETRAANAERGAGTGLTRGAARRPLTTTE